MHDDFPTSFPSGRMRDPGDEEPGGVTPDDDTPLEPWLREIAVGYNAPPPPPREEMWERIRAARSIRRRLVPRSAWRVAALAAALALAVGVGTAGWWRDSSVDAARDNAIVAAERASGASVGRDVATVASVGPAEPTAPAPLAVREPLRASGDEALDGRLARPGQLLAAATAHPPTPAGAPARARRVVGGAGGVGAPFRLEFALHVGQAETLLTAFQADVSQPAVDPSYQPWARELLTTTRLLQDSPAGRDPAMGTLLDELEPVLVQIAQLGGLPPDRMAEERQLISRSLERADLMTQLRAALPPDVAEIASAGE